MTNPDFAGFVRIGYRINGHLRIELEGGYRHEGVQSITGVGVNDGLFICNANSGAGTCETPGGSVNAWTGMGNLLIDVLPHSRINPFVGGGVGFVDISSNTHGTVCDTEGCFTGDNLDNVNNLFGRFELRFTPTPQSRTTTSSQSRSLRVDRQS